jgi:hypothetical protein
MLSIILPAAAPAAKSTTRTLPTTLSIHNKTFYETRLSQSYDNNFGLQMMIYNSGRPEGLTGRDGRETWAGV